MSEKKCVHEAWVEMLGLVAAKIPLVVLWLLDDEAREEWDVCEAHSIESSEDGERLLSEGPCDHEPQWLMAMPAVNQGTVTLPLCTRHLALVVLKGEEHVEETS